METSLFSESFLNSFVYDLPVTKTAWKMFEETADLVTFTEETVMENFIFCAVNMEFLSGNLLN